MLGYKWQISIGLSFMIILYGCKKKPKDLLYGAASSYCVGAHGILLTGNQNIFCCDSKDVSIGSTAAAMIKSSEPKKDPTQGCPLSIVQSELEDTMMNPVKASSMQNFLYDMCIVAKMRTKPTVAKDPALKDSVDDLLHQCALAAASGAVGISPFSGQYGNAPGGSEAAGQSLGTLKNVNIAGAKGTSALAATSTGGGLDGGFVRKPAMPSSLWDAPRLTTGGAGGSTTSGGASTGGAGAGVSGGGTSDLNGRTMGDDGGSGSLGSHARNSGDPQDLGTGGAQSIGGSGGGSSFNANAQRSFSDYDVVHGFDVNNSTKFEYADSAASGRDPRKSGLGYGNEISLEQYLSLLRPEDSIFEIVSMRYVRWHAIFGKHGF